LIIYASSYAKRRWSARRPTRDIKKSCRHFQPTNLTLTYQFIQPEESNFPVRLLCKILNVSKTASYTYRNGTTFTPSDSNQTMTTTIDKIFCRAACTGKLKALWQPSRTGSAERAGSQGRLSSGTSFDARAELAGHSAA
jgi:hypothetical protein